MCTDLGGQCDDTIAVVTGLMRVTVAIPGDDIARRPQAVSVQDAGSVAAVCQHDTRGTVPRFHMHGVIFIKRAQRAIHRLHVLPRGRNQQAHRAEQIDTPRQQRLEHIVEAGGVGARHRDQRQGVFEIGQQRRRELMCTRQRPQAIALNGIDLAVVGEVTERVRQAPLRPGVGGEALMKHAQGRGHALVVQIRIEHR